MTIFNTGHIRNRFRTGASLLPMLLLLPAAAHAADASANADEASDAGAGEIVFPCLRQAALRLPVFLP